MKNLKEGTGAGRPASTVNCVSFAQDNAPLSLTIENKSSKVLSAPRSATKRSVNYDIAAYPCRYGGSIVCPTWKGKPELSLLLWAD
jgi:hypothetical protein